MVIYSEEHSTKSSAQSREAYIKGLTREKKLQWYTYIVIINSLRFTWDENKNKANQKKHKISFDEARTVFLDENAIEFVDPYLMPEL